MDPTTSVVRTMMDALVKLQTDNLAAITGSQNETLTKLVEKMSKTYQVSPPRRMAYNEDIIESS